MCCGPVDSYGATDRLGVVRALLRVIGVTFNGGGFIFLVLRPPAVLTDVHGNPLSATEMIFGRGLLVASILSVTATTGRSAGA